MSPLKLLLHLKKQPYCNKCICYAS